MPTFTVITRVELHKDEACPAPTTETRRGRKCVQRIGAAPENDGVALHLSARLGLEAHHRIGLRHGPMHLLNA